MVIQLSQKRLRWKSKWRHSREACPRLRSGDRGAGIQKISIQIHFPQLVEQIHLSYPNFLSVRICILFKYRLALLSSTLLPLMYSLKNLNLSVRVIKAGACIFKLDRSSIIWRAEILLTNLACSKSKRQNICPHNHRSEPIYGLYSGRRGKSPDHEFP